MRIARLSPIRSSVLVSPRLGAAALVALLAAGCATTPVRPAVDNPPRAVLPAPLQIPSRPVIGLALGGGAARGFAHVGVLAELERNGITPDIIVGTSAGSVVGALYAGGLRGQRMLDAASRLDRGELTDWTLPDRGIIGGESLQGFVNQTLNDTPIERLGIRFAAVATDLRSGRAALFTWGNTGMAVRASSSFPGLIRPVTIAGRDYVDGGLVSQVPARFARELGADVVIAVDVSKLPDAKMELDSTWEVVRQSFLIMAKTVVDNEIREADVLIRPDVTEIALADFEQRERAIEAGRRAVTKAMANIAEVLAAKARAKQAGAQ